MSNSVASVPVAGGTDDLVVADDAACCVGQAVVDVAAFDKPGYVYVFLCFKSCSAFHICEPPLERSRPNFLLAVPLHPGLLPAPRSSLSSLRPSPQELPLKARQGSPAVNQ